MQTQTSRTDFYLDEFFGRCVGETFNLLYWNRQLNARIQIDDDARGAAIISGGNSMPSFAQYPHTPLCLFKFPFSNGHE